MKSNQNLTINTINPMDKEKKGMSEINRRDGIKIEGRIGTWYVVGEKEFPTGTYYLVESEIYGDEAEWLLIDSDYKVIADEIYDGWDSVEEYIEMGELTL